MIKIKLECWWTDTHSLSQRLIKQFIPENDLLDYSFVDENPDYTIIFGKTDWDKIQTPKHKTFYISQEPLWSPNQPNFGIEKYCSKILISDKKNYPDTDEYVEVLLPMFYAGRGETDYREEYDWSKEIKNKHYDKSEIVSMIVTKDYRSHFYSLENLETHKIIYKDRMDLGISLSRNEKIDIYGTFWEKNDKNLKGEVWNKHVGLDPYKFSIACENTIQKNYISEKFWDVILTDTVPIYLGCSNIEEYIPKECFISLNGLSQEEMVSKIECVIRNESFLYDQYIENVINLKKDFFVNYKYNLWETIKKLVNE